MDVIIADSARNELGVLLAINSLDIDIGETEDFELVIPLYVSDKFKGFKDIELEQFFYIPGTEYGGILEDVHISTYHKRRTWKGMTWRGLLTKAVIPLKNGEVQTVSGEANGIIRTLLSGVLGGFFYVPNVSSGITISNYTFEKWDTVLNGLIGMLESAEATLDIRVIRGDPFAVQVMAKPKTNLSETIEYTQDRRVNLTVRDCRTGINHLWCLGKENTIQTDGYRDTVHLYWHPTNGIVTTKYYTGLSERIEYYENSSAANVTKLEEEGRKKFLDLVNYKDMTVTVQDEELNVGDYVTGRDKITETVVTKPIIRKILKLQDGKYSTEYKTKGE
ncbi:MAG: hypothetical protein ACK5MN_12275 [Lachnospiraceae bacterium]